MTLPILTPEWMLTRLTWTQRENLSWLTGIPRKYEIETETLIQAQQGMLYYKAPHENDTEAIAIAFIGNQATDFLAEIFPYRDEAILKQLNLNGSIIDVEKRKRLPEAWKTTSYGSAGIDRYYWLLNTPSDSLESLKKRIAQFPNSQILRILRLKPTGNIALLLRPSPELSQSLATKFPYHHWSDSHHKMQLNRGHWLDDRIKKIDWQLIGTGLWRNGLGETKTSQERFNP